jgi:hypothetical protein
MEAGTEAGLRNMSPLNVAQAISAQVAPDWVNIVLESEYVTTSTTASDTGLAFTPEANKIYEIRGVLMLQSAATTTGIRPSIVGASGVTAQSYRIAAPLSASAEVMRHGQASVVPSGVTGVAIADVPWISMINGICAAGASPSGSIKIQLDTEVSGSAVRALAGSFLSYRIIAST